MGIETDKSLETGMLQMGLNSPKAAVDGEDNDGCYILAEACLLRTVAPGNHRCIVSSRQSWLSKKKVRN